MSEHKQSDGDVYQATKAIYERYARTKDGYYSSRRRLLNYSVWQLWAWRTAYRYLRRQLARGPRLDSAIEVGCGRGDFAIKLAREFPGLERVAGCDFSDGAIEVAQRQGAPVEFAVGNVLRLNYREREFGAVFCVNVLAHIPDHDMPTAIGELCRISRHFLCVELKNADSLYYRRRKAEVDGVPIFPTRASRVCELAAENGFRLVGRRNVFGLDVASPMIVLAFQR